MFLPTADGRFQLERRDTNWHWRPVNRFATAEAALAHVAGHWAFRVTDLETGERIEVRQDRPGVLTITDGKSRTAFIRKPGTVPPLGITGTPLERGFAVNPHAAGQPMPSIDGADDPAFAAFLRLANRGVAMNAAAKGA